MEAVSEYPLQPVVELLPEYMPMAPLVGSPASSFLNSKLCTLSKHLGKCLQKTADLLANTQQLIETAMRQNPWRSHADLKAKLLPYGFITSEFLIKKQ